MKRFGILVAGWACLILCGCANITYMAWTGPQQEWPTSPGAFISKSNGMDFYSGYPPRPYTILGKIHASTTVPTRGGGFVVGGGFSAPIYQNDMTVVAIKFKAPPEKPSSVP